MATVAMQNVTGTTALVNNCNSTTVPLDKCHPYKVLEDLQTEKTVISWICYLVGSAGFLENILVLVVIGTSVHLRGRPSYLLIGSLAIADILASCFFTVIFLEFHLSNKNIHENEYLFKLAGVTMAFTGSLGSLLLTALDRYLCICQAQHYRKLLTQRRAIVGIAVLWIVTIVVSFLPLMGWRCRVCSSCSSLFPYIDRRYLGSSTSLFLVVLVLIMLAYALILWRAHQHEAVMGAPQPRGMTIGRQARMRTDIRLARTLGLILLILTVCWVPVLSLMLLDVLKDKLTIEQRKAFAFCSTLGCLGYSAINPLLYAMRCRELRRALVSLLRSVGSFRPWRPHTQGDGACNQRSDIDTGTSNEKQDNNNSASVNEPQERPQLDSEGGTLGAVH